MLNIYLEVFGLFGTWIKKIFKKIGGQGSGQGGGQGGQGGGQGQKKIKLSYNEFQPWEPSKTLTN